MLVAVLLAGCQQPLGPQERDGLIGGAAGGLLIGAGVGGLAALAIGTAAGAIVGGGVGHALDERDRREARRAERYAVRLGKPRVWRNRASNHHGRVEPTATFRDAHGRLCRSFSHTILIDGRRETGVGVGCRNKDGHWVLHDALPPAPAIHASNQR